LNHCTPQTRQHGVITHKATMLILIAMKTSNYIQQHK
jgi:hypothetical protein